MSQFTLQRNVGMDRESIYTRLVDPGRMPRWMPWTEKIENPSGPLDRAGSTFSQRGAAGIRRPGGVIAATPPSVWHVRIAGGGERVDLVFTLSPSAEGTRITLTADIRNGPGILGRAVDVVAGRLDRRSWRRALDRLVGDLVRTPLVVNAGDLVSVEGGVVRIAQVIGLSETHVHLRLFAGRHSARPDEVDPAALTLSRPRDYRAVQPLMPTLRSAAFSPSLVAPGLLADGGLGLAHLPMTRRAFDDADPRPAGHADLPAEVDAQIASWRNAGGAAFGDEREPGVGAYFSVALRTMGIESDGFGIIKLLRQQVRGVHIRTYSSKFAQRPEMIEEARLESRPAILLISGDRPPTELLAVGHLPLGHASFETWQPVFIAMALVQPDELLGYEEWKLAEGGFF